MTEQPILMRRTSDHPPGDCPGGCDEISVVGRRLADGKARMDTIEADLKKNTADTAEILDILRMGRTFFRFAAYFGRFIKWVSIIGASALTFWYAIKDWPKH